MDFAISTERISKIYKGFLWKKNVDALSELTLKVPEHTVFGFLGPNGAGKTTTIKLLMDLIKPSTGVATVLGKPTNNVGIKSQIGYLPDAPAFSSHLTAKKFLIVCAKLLKIPYDKRAKRIEEVLEDVDMTKYTHSLLGGFSRGMTQRIGFAQAILNHPRLLVLDEPLVGLDPHGRLQFKQIIQKQKENGATIFFCSHILSDVENICDMAGILKEGKLLCSGKMQDLLASTGIKVNLKAGNDTLFSTLVSKASSSNKTDDNSWEMIFNNNKETKDFLDSIKKENIDSLTMSSTKETLEEFFFRKIEAES